VLPIKKNFAKDRHKCTPREMIINGLFAIFMVVPVVIHIIFPLNSEILSAKIAISLLITCFIMFCVLWRQSTEWLGYNYIDGVAIPDSLVVNSPYVLARNPIYLAQIGLVSCLGFTMVITTINNFKIISLVSVISACLIMVIKWNNRIKREELLLMTFDNFETYHKIVPKIVYGKLKVQQMATEKYSGKLEKNIASTRV